MPQTFICKHCRGPIHLDMGKMSDTITAECLACSTRLVAYDGILMAMEKVIKQFEPAPVEIKK